MAEFDEITAEEHALAERLAQELDAGVAPGDDSLSDPIALLKASKRWDPSEEQLQRTRDDVLDWAKKAQSATPRKTSPRMPWLAWLPLPAVALLALVYGLKTEESATKFAQRHKEVAAGEVAATEEAFAPQLEGADAADTVAQDSDSEDAEPVAKKRAAEISPLKVASKDRWHEGEIPPGLLRAQAELLAAKSANSPVPRTRFEAEMRSYRAQLLARAEMEGAR